jgi:hypothetical protein
MAVLGQTKSASLPTNLGGPQNEVEPLV